MILKQKFFQIFFLLFLGILGVFQVKEVIIKPTNTLSIFQDDHFNFQFIRTLSTAVAQMADINECFSTAQQIENGNIESWYKHWYVTAERIHSLAIQALNEGHSISAQSAFLRASNYYRTSEFYLHGNPRDPRICDISKKSRNCFIKAIGLMKTSIIPVLIPYEGITLPGYFYTIDNEKRPTIIIQTGFDGTQEEIYMHALEAIKRGYNVLTFEGPGQGAVLREQGVPFRPDWEIVIRAVVDFIITQPKVDSSMLILYGMSFGGYFASRGASGDNRIKVLIANGGFYDLLEAQAAIKGNTKDILINNIKKDTTAFNQEAQQMMKTQTSVRFWFEHGMFSFGVQTPSELELNAVEYTLKNRANLITCRTLIVDSDQEMPIFRGQAEQIFKSLTCPKTYMLFTSKEAAGLHCQSGALLLSTQRIFDWLDTTIEQLKSMVPSLKLNV